LYPEIIKGNREISTPLEREPLHLWQGLKPRSNFLTGFTYPSFHIFILVALCSIIFLVNLGGWDLWGPDEPRYAQVAKEMMESGNWAVPHLNSKVYPDKPPVFFWLITLSSIVKGEVTSFTARFPSAIAAVLGIFLTYLLGSKLYNLRAGFISALVLATTVEYFWLGHRANIDMTLTLFILSALLFFYQGYQKPRKRYYYFFYLSMALATLTKGPVGFILPSLTVIFYLSLRKDFNVLKKVFFNWGVLLFWVVILAWLIPACMQGGKSYSDEILFNQILGRVYNSWSHKAPFYYYFLRLPPIMLPWFFFLPSAFIYFFIRRKKIEADYLFPTVWFTTIFVFFTLCSGKRELYMLPLFPAFALMVGFLWNKFFEQNEDMWGKRLTTLPLYLLLGLLLAACLCVPFIPKSIGYEYRQGFHFYPVALILGLSTIFAFFFLLKKRTAFSFSLIIMMMAGSFLYTVDYVFPYLNQYKSAKPFSLRIKTQMKEGDLLGAYRVKTPAFNFYTGIKEIEQLETTSELINFFFQSKSRAFCLMKKKDLKELSPIMPFHLFRLDGGRIGGDEIILISNCERR